MQTDADRAADLRGALTRAARTELAEGGSAAVSLRAVARRAGVSHAAPGYAFGDRAGLLTAVATQGFQELAALMDHAPTATGRDGLAELGRRYVAFAEADPALYGLMFRSSELVEDDPELQAARAASLRRLTRVTRQDHVEAPPSQLTLISWAFAHGVASLVSEGRLARGDTDELIGGFSALTGL